MAISDRKNQNLMNFIRKVHGVVENVDLEKHSSFSFRTRDNARFPPAESPAIMISRAFGNFEGFPPVYIQVGDNEILLNDATMLHKKMVKENVSVKIDVRSGEMRFSGSR